MPEIWPDYPTRLPPASVLHYRSNSEEQGGATLSWKPAGDSYSLDLELRSPSRPARAWHGEGGFDPRGVAPRRLVQIEHGRETRAINFEREKNIVSFSSSKEKHALTSSLQDRWSWIPQLAAVAQAASTPWRAGSRIHLRVAGLRGEVARWTFEVQDDDAWPADAPAAPIRPDRMIHLLRWPERPYDLRVEVWLAPWLNHFPAGLKMETPPSRWSLGLWFAPGTADDEGS